MLNKYKVGDTVRIVRESDRYTQPDVGLTGVVTATARDAPFPDGNFPAVDVLISSDRTSYYHKEENIELLKPVMELDNTEMNKRMQELGTFVPASFERE